MNKVLLVGRLTRDPELRTTPGGMAVTRFTIAVSQNFTNKNGERGADFINCSAWGRQADNISKYCRKGTLVSAEGRIRTSSYDAQDGTKRYTTEVVCDTVNFLSPKGSSENGSSSSYSGSNSYENNNNSNMGMDTVDLSNDPYSNFGEEITLNPNMGEEITLSSDDDLPF